MLWLRLKVARMAEESEVKRGHEHINARKIWLELHASDTTLHKTLFTVLSVGFFVER